MVVAVGVDDNIRSMGEGVIDAETEGGGEAAVAAEGEDVVGTAFACDFYGAVGAAVVDDEVFDTIDPRDFAGKIGKGLWKGVFLVETRNLDEEFHGERL